MVYFRVFDHRSTIVRILGLLKIIFMKKMIAICLLSTVTLLAMGQTNIGLQLYTFRAEFKQDVPGTLEKISKMGIRQIEGGGSYGLPMDEYKKMLAANKLTMISIGADYKELETDVQKVVKDAKAFGAKYVMCAWVPHGAGFTKEDADKAIAVFNAAGKTLKENGISFCYHAHGYEFGPYKNGTLFDYMAQNMKPAYANFEMDVFWVKHPGQDPVALLKKYPGRFKAHAPERSQTRNTLYAGWPCGRREQCGARRRRCGYSRHYESG